MKQIWKLTYFSILDFERHTYMNIGFESPEAAEREKKRLERDYEKQWSKHTDEDIQQMWTSGYVMYVSMFGRDFKVEPIKLRVL